LPTTFDFIALDRVFCSGLVTVSQKLTFETAGEQICSMPDFLSLKQQRQSACLPRSPAVDRHTIQL